MNLLMDLFLTFAKVGLFTFGGGYAMTATTGMILLSKDRGRDPDPGCRGQNVSEDAEDAN